MYNTIVRDMRKKRVLFICTHNSCRSQMAEGMLRDFYRDYYEVYSAGTEPAGVDPYSIRVMSEVGIDISSQRSKSVDEFLGQDFDYVITVCDSAKKTCPVFSGTHKKVHWNLEDPAKAQGNEEERLKVFRDVRDQIKERIIKDLRPRQ